MFYRNAQRRSKQRNGSLKFLSRLFFAILILQTQEIKYACYSLQGCSYILVYFSLRVSSPIMANGASCARTSERHKPPLVCGSQVTFRDK